MAKVADNQEGLVKSPAARSTTKTDKIINIQPHHRPWLYSVGAVLVLLIVFALGAAVASSRHGMFGNEKIRPLAGQLQPARSFGGRFRADGFSSGNLNGQTRMMGVVISVNGSNFTIAANGSTTNVTTNSSTQYKYGNQVKQNDTVLVSGSENNGTLTASNIAINP